jgi:hypothetical protein
MAREKYNNADVEAAAKAIEKDLEDAFAQLHAYLKDQLAKLNRDGQILSSDTFNISRVKNIVERLQLIADENGFREAIENQSRRLTKLADAILEEAGDSGLPDKFAKSTGESLDALVWGVHREMLASERKIASDLERLIVRSVTGNVQWTDLIESLQNTMEINERQAVTAAMDAMASFHTVIRSKHFEAAGVTWFLYDGPADEINRDFCSEFVGRRVTLEMLDAYSDSFGRKHPLPASVSLGGYGCRHELIPLVEQEDIDSYEPGPRSGAKTS